MEELLPWPQTLREGEEQSDSGFWEQCPCHLPPPHAAMPREQNSKYCVIPVIGITVAGKAVNFFSAAIANHHKKRYHMVGTYCMGLSYSPVELIWQRSPILSSM